jgi:hypothetical protein
MPGTSPLERRLEPEKGNLSMAVAPLSRASPTAAYNRARVMPVPRRSLRTKKQATSRWTVGACGVPIRLFGACPDLHWQLTPGFD